VLREDPVTWSYFFLSNQTLSFRESTKTYKETPGILITVEEAVVSKHNWCCGYRRSVSVPRSEIRMRWNLLAVYTQTCLLSAYWRQKRGLSVRLSSRWNLR
jgi:hypothetical protein